eukprot:3175249-Rhodomonas_salina.3
MPPQYDPSLVEEELYKVLLAIPYAIPVLTFRTVVSAGTDLAYAATVSLRLPYAISGTDIAHAAINHPTRTLRHMRY